MTRAQPKTYQVTLPDVALQVTEWPGESDPVLLLHATGFHSRCWDSIARRMPGVHIYAVDVRFHGGSDRHGEVDWLLMAVIGGLGAASHFTLIRALSSAPAALVAPFGYTSLVWSTSLGYLVFAEMPDAWTLCGAAIIIASGLYVLRREQQLREAARTAPPG